MLRISERIKRKKERFKLTECAALESRFISPSIGYGVFATSFIERGTFLLEYKGELLSEDPANNDTYVYEFSFKGKTLWMNADTSCLCRFVNDEHLKPNARMKIIEADSQPRLCLFSIRDIKKEDEVRYNYGDGQYPWRKKVKGGKWIMLTNSDFSSYRGMPSSSPFHDKR